VKHRETILKKQVLILLIRYKIVVNNNSGQNINTHDNMAENNIIININVVIVISYFCYG